MVHSILQKLTVRNPSIRSENRQSRPPNCALLFHFCCFHFKLLSVIFDPFGNVQASLTLLSLFAKNHQFRPVNIQNSTLAAQFFKNHDFAKFVRFSVSLCPSTYSCYFVKLVALLLLTYGFGQLGFVFLWHHKSVL